LKFLDIVHDTWFKLSPEQASDLSDREKFPVEEGEKFKVHSIDLSGDTHVKAALRLDDASRFNGRNTFYVYKGHIKEFGNTRDNKPQDVPPEVIERGRFILLPGHTSRFYLGDPIIPEGHFTWAEATHNGSRTPEDKSVVNGIIKIARVMEEVRDRLGGRPLTINSWYRDRATNQRVGGARYSQHILGSAVDFRHPTIHPYKVYSLLNEWYGARGGLASASPFTHIDARGYEARWSYGF